MSIHRKYSIPLSLAVVVTLACGSEHLPAAVETPPQEEAAGAQAARTGRGNAPSPSIGAEQVIITSEFAWTETLYRAFVRTGSLSANSLCSVKDAVNPGNVQLVTCGAREFGGERGMIVSVFFFHPPAPDEFVEVVVYQEGARPFSPPVFAPIG